MLNEKTCSTITENIFPNYAYHLAIPDEIYLKFALDLAKKYGFSWWSNSSIDVYSTLFEKIPFSLIINDKKTIDWNYPDSKSHPYITLNEYENLLKYFSRPREEKIFINDNYEVVFNPDQSINVGCQKIDYSTMEKIWNRVNKK